MSEKLIVSSSPHFWSKISTSRVMLDVIIALIPATIAGAYFFGLRALLVCAVTILACVAAEYVCRRAMGRENTVMDLSAVVTGLLLALNLPPAIELWKAAVGGVLAIVIVKQLFGGIGQNFMNPALAARVMLLTSWGGSMTRWSEPLSDAISGATPLALAKQQFQGMSGIQLPSYADLFLGSIAGCIGETSALALIIGAVYLLVRKVISWEIPAFYIATTAIMTWMLGGVGGIFTGDPVFHVLSGGLLLGACFMATDYSTSPMTRKGKMIMGFGCGLLTVIIRLYTGSPEGVSFAIIIMNVIVPLIDRYTVPKVFGGERRA